MSLSSCDLGYKAAKEACKEVVQLSNVLTMLRLVWKSHSKLRCDNQSAIQLSYNLMYHSKTKNIYLSIHYILDIIGKVVIYL